MGCNSFGRPKLLSDQQRPRQVHTTELFTCKQFLRRWQPTPDASAATTVARAIADAFDTDVAAEEHAAPMRAALGDGMATHTQQTSAFVEWISALANRRLDRGK